MLPTLLLLGAAVFFSFVVRVHALAHVLLAWGFVGVAVLSVSWLTRRWPARRTRRASARSAAKRARIWEAELDAAVVYSAEKLVDELERAGSTGWVKCLNNAGTEDAKRMARERGFAIRFSEWSERDLPNVQYAAQWSGIDSLTGALNGAALEHDLDPESGYAARSFVYADVNGLGRLERPEAEAVVAAVGHAMVAEARGRRVYRTRSNGDEFLIADDDAEAADRYATLLESALDYPEGVTVIRVPAVSGENPDALLARAAGLMRKRKRAAGTRSWG